MLCNKHISGTLTHFCLFPPFLFFPPQSPSAFPGSAGSLNRTLTNDLYCIPVRSNTGSQYCTHTCSSYPPRTEWQGNQPAGLMHGHNHLERPLLPNRLQTWPPRPSSYRYRTVQYQHQVASPRDLHDNRPRTQSQHDMCCAGRQAWVTRLAYVISPAKN